MIDSVINENVLHPYSELAGYEKKYSLKELHDDMLVLLVAFDQFCRAHEISYSLADGTLLGAIRHGDFIPWDDDADVMVTRMEYQKLRKAINGDSSIKLLKAHFLDRVTTPALLKKKVYLDLFINEDMPASKVIFEWKKFKTRFLRCAFHNISVRNVRHDQHAASYSYIRGMAARVLRGIAKCVICGRDVFELNDRTVAIKGHRPLGIYTRYTSRMYETNRRFNKASYDEGYADVAFRGQRLMVIKNAGKFLQEMYGDYMKLLPEEKRKPEHPVNMMDSPESCLKRYN